MMLKPARPSFLEVRAVVQNSGLISSAGIYGNNSTIYMNTTGQTVTIRSDNDVIHLSPDQTTTATYAITEGNFSPVGSVAYSNPTNLVVTGFTAGQDIFIAPTVASATNFSAMNPSNGLATVLYAASGPINGGNLRFCQ